MPIKFTVDVGWKGTWDAKKGYTKFYTVYDAVEAAD
jgi:hypothetical protein